MNIWTHYIHITMLHCYPLNSNSLLRYWVTWVATSHSWGIIQTWHNGWNNTKDNSQSENPLGNTNHVMVVSFHSTYFHELIHAMYLLTNNKWTIQVYRHIKNKHGYRSQDLENGTWCSMMCFHAMVVFGKRTTNVQLHCIVKNEGI